MHPPTNWKVNLGLIVVDNICNFVCGTMSHVKLLLHWSVIHYQTTFECLSGCSSETSIYDGQAIDVQAITVLLY